MPTNRPLSRKLRKRFFICYLCGGPRSENARICIRCYRKAPELVTKYGKRGPDGLPIKVVDYRKLKFRPGDVVVVTYKKSRFRWEVFRVLQVVPPSHLKHIPGWKSGVSAVEVYNARLRSPLWFPSSHLKLLYEAVPEYADERERLRLTEDEVTGHRVLAPDLGRDHESPRVLPEDQEGDRFVERSST